MRLGLHCSRRKSLGGDGGEMEGDGSDGLGHFGCKSVQAQVGCKDLKGRGEEGLACQE